jgi:hypothetical protein
VEKLGVPTTPLVTRAFKDLAILNVAKRGMPHERITFTPHPVASKTPEQLRAYVEGNDPVSGKPMMKEIVDALTVPLTEEEKKTGTVHVSAGPDKYGPDTVANLRQYYHDNGMTDYLPVVIPTQEAVEEMLAGSSHKPDEQVGTMAAATGAYPAWSFTVKQVAINAVMAGCRPEYFPVLLAIASSGQTSLSSSTNSFASAAIINGPIRDKLQMNYGIGALGPFAQSNAAIGRAWLLISKNLANGGIPGDTYMGSLGNNLNYNNLIIAENEAASPWAPFHVQKGFEAKENVVSLFRGLGIVPGQGARGTSTDTPKYEEQFSDLFSVLTGFFGGLVVADPLIAQNLKERGYDTKEKLIDWLYKNTTQSVKDYKGRDFAYGFDYPRSLKGLEPYATWYKMPDDAMIPRWPRASDINVVVTGGQTNAFFQGASLSYTVSISIDKWM